MADEKKDAAVDKLREMADAKNKPTQEQTPPPAAQAAPATPVTPAAVKTTSEFDAQDPTYPVVTKETTRVRAKEAYKTRVEKDAEGKDITVGTFRVHEANTPIDAVVDADYTIAEGNALTDEGKKAIESENKKLSAMKEEAMLRIRDSKGQTLALQNFVRAHSTYILPIVRNEVETHLSVVTSSQNKDKEIAQKAMGVSLAEKGTGPVLAHYLVVPVRAYDVLSNDQEIPDEEVAEIVNEKTPALKTVTISKTDFATVQIAIFGGAIKVAPEMFDTHSSKFARLEDIGSIDGLPEKTEFITFTLDPSKSFVLKAAESVTRKPEETDEAFKARKDRHDKKQAVTDSYRNGSITLAEKAAIIKPGITTRATIICSSNYLPVNTFDTLQIGNILTPADAATLNDMYLSGLINPTNTSVIGMSADAQSKVRVADGSIQSSIFFPAEGAMAGKIPAIHRLYRTRKGDGTVSKDEFKPNRIAKRIAGTSSTGKPTKNVVRHEIGTTGYRDTRYGVLRDAFTRHINTLSSEQASGLHFITPEEVKAATTRQKTGSTKLRKLSSTSYDRTAVDIAALMTEFALGNGSLILASASTQNVIKDVKRQQVKLVPTITKFNKEALKEKLKAKN